MQARPPRLGPAVLLHTVLGIFCRDCACDGRVKTTAKEHSVRHVRHQLALYGSHESLAQLPGIGRVVPDCIILKPVPCVPPCHLPVRTPVIVSREERLIFVAETFEGLELACDIDCPVLVPADVERNNPDRVPCHQQSVLFLIVKGECENAVKVIQKADALLFIKGENDFTVRACLEIILPGKTPADVLMVVDLTVDSEDFLSVRGIERLSS